MGTRWPILAALASLRWGCMVLIGDVQGLVDVLVQTFWISWAS